MSRYDILCGRAPKPIAVQGDGDFHRAIVVNFDEFCGLSYSMEMSKYIGKEIVVKKYIEYGLEEGQASLLANLSAGVAQNHLWFQEQEEKEMPAGYPERSCGNIKGKKGWLYYGSWLRFLD